MPLASFRDRPTLPSEPGGSQGDGIEGGAENCQGTGTFTRLRDTNLYEQNRQPRTIRGDSRAFLPVPP